MCLVNHDIADLHLLHIALEKTGSETFRRDIKELEVSVKGIVQGIVHFPSAHSGIDAEGTYSPICQVLHLVLHQGDQRSNHDSNSVLHHAWYLETHRLATSRRENGKNVTSFEGSVDDFLLFRTKTIIAPILFKCFLCGHSAKVQKLS